MESISRNTAQAIYESYLSMSASKDISEVAFRDGFNELSLKSYAYGGKIYIGFKMVKRLQFRENVVIDLKRVTNITLGDTTITITEGDQNFTIKTEGESGRPTYKVDDKLSYTSSNPVQNKVITNALDKKVDTSYLPELATVEYVDEELDKKVDKVTGKQLSTEDFTTELKQKLESIQPSDAPITKVKVNGSELPIVDKAVNVPVPTKTSQLTNDSGFTSESYVDTKVSAEAVSRANADTALDTKITAEATARETEDTTLATAINTETTNRVYDVTVLNARVDAIESRTDVVDIVGTKAELLAYDTSKLSENDVIKVLRDESKNNAITYYRFNKPKTWTFIGDIGPYYTTAETDAMLAYKLDNVLNVANGVLVTNASKEVKTLGIGTNGQVLTTVSGTPAWKTITTAEVEPTANRAYPTTAQINTWNEMASKTIPTKLSQLETDDNNQRVSSTEKTIWNNKATTAYVDDKVKDSTITIKQGNETKGSFTLNQATSSIITLDASSNPVLTKAITANQTVGGVSSGTEFPKGTPLEDIIKAILYVPPTPTGFNAYYGATNEIPTSLDGLTRDEDITQPSQIVSAPWQTHITAGDTSALKSQYVVVAVSDTVSFDNSSGKGWQVADSPIVIQLPVVSTHIDVGTSGYNVYYLENKVYDADEGGTDYKIYFKNAE